MLSTSNTLFLLSTIHGKEKYIISTTKKSIDELIVQIKNNEFKINLNDIRVFILCVSFHTELMELLGLNY